MFTPLLAFLLAASSPAQVTQLNPENDAPAICLLRLGENLKRLEAGEQPDNRVIDLYAEKAKMTPEQKAKLTDRCDFFDIGVFIANQIHKERSYIKTSD